jgi:hypothetical protein
VVTIRLDLAVVVEGRVVGTLTGDEAEFVAGYIRRGYTFSGVFSERGEVDLRGTPI